MVHVSSNPVLAAKVRQSFNWLAKYQGSSDLSVDEARKHYDNLTRSEVRHQKQLDRLKETRPCWSEDLRRHKEHEASVLQSIGIISKRRRFLRALIEQHGKITRWIDNYEVWGSDRIRPEKENLDPLRGGEFFGD